MRTNAAAEPTVDLPIAIIVPAVGRISSWPTFGGNPLLIPMALLGLLGALVAYDILARRPHQATLIGVALLIAAGVGAQVLGQSEFGQSVVLCLVS